MKYKVPFIKPSFPSANDITDDYSKIIQSNWFTNFGPVEEEFREKVALFIDKKVFTTTVANATLGLEVAVRSLLVRHPERNHVLAPSFTFASGLEVLISNNFRPVLIDVETTTLQPSLAEAEAYIKLHKEKMAGILLCNTFGVGNKDIEKWETLASKHQLSLIIDSAAGLGSEYIRNERIGARGDCEVFSLHATKPFCVGEGGMISSKDPELIEKMRSIQNFGFGKNRDIESIGLNAKLQELNCAIGLRQLDKYQERLEKRRRTLLLYKEGMVKFGYTFQENDELSTVPFASALAPTQDAADAFREKLDSNLVEAKQYYRPLHKEAVIANQSILASDFKVTEDVYSRIISLPVHDEMKESDIVSITEMVY